MNKKYFIMDGELWYTYEGWRGFLKASPEEKAEYLNARSYFKEYK